MEAPEFCETLLRETGFMVFPGALFGDDSPDYIRLSYLQPLDRIKEAVGRLEGFLAKRRAVA